MSNSSQPADCSPPGSSVHGDSPGKNTGVGFHALFQGIFPTWDRTDISLSPALAGGFFTTSATWEDCCFGHTHFINGSIETQATEVTWPAVTVHVLVLNKYRALIEGWPDCNTKARSPGWDRLGLFPRQGGTWAPPLTAFSRQFTVCFLLCLFFIVLVPTTLISEYFFTIVSSGRCTQKEQVWL